MSIEIRAASIEERPAVCHLINTAFDAESYGPSLEKPLTSLANWHMDPHDRPEYARVLFADGRMAAFVQLAERETYVCGERARCGYVAMVATHPDSRGRGLMSRLMADSERFMRERGWVYALLLGGFRTYGGSLGWLPCGEKLATLPWKYVVPVRGEGDAGISARIASEKDVPFLIRLYQERYSARFGPVVRSPEYWLHWSLHHWEGPYVVVADGARPVGYFHASRDGGTVDEIGWDDDSASKNTRMFLAARSWAAAQGCRDVSFWVGDVDMAADEAFREAFGAVQRTFCGPDGQPAESSDPGPCRLGGEPDAFGYMVKHLNRGPGVLADVANTEDLANAMARHAWAFFDGDMM